MKVAFLLLQIDLSVAQWHAFQHRMLLKRHKKDLLRICRLDSKAFVENTGKGKA